MGWHRQNSGFRGPSVGFALGSLLFAIGAAPGYATTVGAHIGNLTYFAGSLFFTAAAFAEFRFTGRVTPGPSTSRVNRYDWWSALIQFVGTVLFNLSTGAAVIRSLSAPERYEFVWQPDMFGSLCFLVSSGLAVVATTIPGDTRVLRLDTRSDGYLFVETGRLAGPRAGAGRQLLLRRTDAGWVVAEEASWKA
jgi:hypothetical protein